MEVIVNPANQLNPAEFMELNDLINNDSDEEVQIQQIPPQDPGQEIEEIQQMPLQALEQPPPQVHLHQPVLNNQLNLNLMAEEQHLMNIADLEMQDFQIDPVELEQNEELLEVNELAPELHIPNENIFVMEGPAQHNLQIEPVALHLAGPHVILEAHEPAQNELGLGLPANLEAHEHAPAEENEIPEDQMVYQNLQVGRALLFGPEADPVWAQRSRTAEATRLWARFFAQGNANHLHLAVPSGWVNFFTAMLLSPSLFNWAKDFLSSKAADCLRVGDGVVDFHVPQQCPQYTACVAAPKTKLSSLEEDEEVGKRLQEPKSTPKKRGPKRTCPVVETELRRSSRGKQVNNGTRRGICSDKKCFFCLPNPPTLSKQVIKRLGKELGELEDEQLTDEALLKKKEQKKIGQKKKMEEGEEEPRKKGNGDEGPKNPKKKNGDKSN